MKKKPRFFCDHCGLEVNRDVKSCPGCGRYFASVRCPKCTYSGPDEMFQGGCPMCGYSTPPPEKTNVKKIKQPKKSGYSDLSANIPWAFIASAIALLAVISFLSYFITR